jgi:hypothetical protein
LLSGISACDAEIKRLENEMENITEQLNLEYDNKEKIQAEYRKVSAMRVMEYVRSHNLPQDDAIRYITHCIDKLNGSIDGVELELGGETDGIN